MSIPPKCTVVLMVLVLCGASFAGTSYVSATGSSCNQHSAYSTIQEAIDAASDGDTIIVCRDGEYSENVVINRPINIRANDSVGKAVVSAGTASNPVFTITADHVNVTNFVLKDATGSYGLYSTASYANIEEVTATNNDIGFYLQGSSHNNLDSNIAHDNFDEGFRLASQSNNNVLADNVAYNQRYYGFYLHGSSGNTLVSNTAYNSSSWYGFFLHSGAQDNVLVDNTAYQNAHHGFHVYLTSNNNLTGNTAYENYAEGFRLSSSQDNTLTGNTAYENYAEGFRLSSSHNNALNGNIAHGNNQSGFLVSSSSGNTFTDNNAYSNLQYGFYVQLSLNNRFSSNIAYLQEDGFRIFGSSNNELVSNTAYYNDRGFYLDLSSDNNLNSNTAHDNTEHGFLFSSSSDNNISDNAAYDNGLYGFYGYLSSDNKLISNAAYRNLNGFRFSSSTNNQVLDNEAYRNSNDGFYLYLSTANLLSGNTVNDNSNNGFYLYESDDNTLVGNDVFDNSYGIYVYLSSDNHLVGNDAYGNLGHGFVVSSGPGNLLANNTAYENSGHGLYLYLSPSNKLEWNTAHTNSQVGCYLHASTNSVMENEHYYSNNIDLGIDASPTAMTVSASGIIFDSPSGNMEDYSNISIIDSLESNSSYWLKWTFQPGTLPHPHISFRNKFLEISSPQTVSIDSVTWHWLDSEAGPGYIESKFRIWQHDALGWLEMPPIPDTDGNNLTVSGLSPASVYGILQNRSVPSMVLHSPLPGELLNTTSLDMSWTTYSFDPVSVSNITINGNIVNAMEIDTQSGEVNNYPVQVPGDGIYYWSVTSMDSIGTNTSETRNFTVDLPPSVQLDSPDPELINDSEYDVGFVVFDNVTDSLNCSLYIDSILDQNGTVASSVPSSFQISGMDEGNHTLLISCEDEAGNVDDSEAKSLAVDTTPPQIDLISPEDGYLGGDSVVTFSFNATDELSEDITSSLYIDDVPVDTTTGDHFTVPVPEGTHNWSVMAVDEAGNEQMSETRTLMLDRTPPVITIHDPANGRRIVSSSPADVSFNFTVTDNHSPLMDCSFYLDGVVNHTDDSVQNGELISLERELSLGTHTWQVECNDDVGNIAITPLRSIYVGQDYPDDDPDDDKDKQDPVIEISRVQNCPEDFLTFTVSSGPNTRLRLLDPYGFVIDSKTTDGNGQAKFSFFSTGLYGIRASKSSYSTTTEMFHYELCDMGDDLEENQTEAELSEEPPEINPTEGHGGEYTGPGEGVAAAHDTIYAPEVKIFVNETAFLGDAILVRVYVNGEPASVNLQLTYPKDNEDYLMTDENGEVTFIAHNIGVHKITVVESDLPNKSAEVEVLKRPVLVSENPAMAYVLSICPPALLILLTLFLLVAYLARRERKRKDRGYKGFKTKKEEGLLSKMRRIIRELLFI